MDRVARNLLDHRQFLLAFLPSREFTGGKITALTFFDVAQFHLHLNWQTVKRVSQWVS